MSGGDAAVIGRVSDEGETCSYPGLAFDMSGIRGPPEATKWRNVEVTDLR